MSRNGLSNYGGMRLRHVFMPYGMRKIDGYGENVWEFYNRQYDVIGFPVKLARKPSMAQLKAAADPAASVSEKEIHFYLDGTFGTRDYWERIEKVMGWKIANGPLEILEEGTSAPHSFRKKTALKNDT